MARPRKPEGPKPQLSFRLPAELVERLDRHVAQLNAERRGLELVRADAVRMLLTEALDRAEKVAAKARRR